MGVMRERYAQEQRKRLRPEGMGQWVELSEDLDRDPFADPGFTREPVDEEVTGEDAMSHHHHSSHTA